jgi:glycosyltransferase involved in cell wall biosynthesis
MSGLARLAICAVAKDEALYIEEWIAFHFLQGVSDILIFDNRSTDGTAEIVGRIGAYLPVNVIDWPGHSCRRMQMEAYREGAAGLAGRADWVAFIDIDEFLFSSRKLSLPTELADFGPEVGAIAIGHRIFGSSGQASYEPNFVTSRFVRCARPDHPHSQHFKSIARPGLVETFDSAHSVVLRAGAYLMADHTPLCRGWYPGHANRVGHGTISLFHYMVKSQEEYGWKQLRFHGKQLEYRYTDQYFRDHDDIGSEVENDELCRFAEPIRKMISEWR